MEKIQTLEYGTYVERMVANKLKPLLDYASYQAESIIEESLKEIDMKMVESYEVEWRPVIKIKLKMAKQKKTWSERFDDKFDNVRGSVYYEEESALGTGAIAHEIKDFIKQEILNVLDEVEQVYKGKLIGITRTTSGEVRFCVWHDELYAKIEEIKKRYE